jgi:hypothetical protein
LLACILFAPARLLLSFLLLLSLQAYSYILSFDEFRLCDLPNL